MVFGVVLELNKAMIIAQVRLSANSLFGLTYVRIAILTYFIDNALNFFKGSTMRNPVSTSATLTPTTRINGVRLRVCCKIKIKLSLYDNNL